MASYKPDSVLLRQGFGAQVPLFCFEDLSSAALAKDDSHLSGPAITGGIVRATFFLLRPKGLRRTSSFFISGPVLRSSATQNVGGFALASGRVCHAHSVTRGRKL